MPAETPDPFPDGITTVLFDFDETIIDLEPQHTGAHAALCRDQGDDYESMPLSMRTASGSRIIDDIRHMRAHFRWTESEEDLFVRRQRHFDELLERAPLELMPGVREAVHELRDRGYRLAITSSAVAASIHGILVRTGLRESFELIVDGSEVAEGKPDPEAYLLTARKLGVRPAECVVIEDSEVGVVAAKRAGMFCIAVPNPRAQTRQDLSAADMVVGRIDEAVSFLRSLR